ncbi:MAG TPA: hypothetical protein VGD50_07070, partial [Candidatus Baltobacteraceae bacterium]
RRIITIPLEERHQSGVRGTVTLSPDGERTIVHVHVFGAPVFHPSLSLRSGPDCLDTMGAATRLSPPNSRQVSQTLIFVPMSALKKSHFVVDVRDASARKQFAEACAHL